MCNIKISIAVLAELAPYRPPGSYVAAKHLPALWGVGLLEGGIGTGQT